MRSIQAYKISLPFLFLLVLLLIPLPHASAAGSQPVKVLLLYDSLAKGTPREGNVTVLQQLLASYRTQVTVSSIDRYKQGTMQAYANVVTVVNDGDIRISNRAYLDDLSAYPGAYLHVGYQLPAQTRDKLSAATETVSRDTAEIAADKRTQANIPVRDIEVLTQTGGSTYGTITFSGSGRKAPFSAEADGTAYVPYFQKGNLSELAMASVLKKWLGIEENGQAYVVLKEIYPFSDLNLLEETADRLYGAGIPFVISIRPVFGNTDFPAMKRYEEALKYVQTRNGSILVNAPVVLDGVSREGGTLREKMNWFIAVLAKNGVAPLGVGTEMYWAYDKEYAKSGLGFFDSAVLFPDVKTLYIDPSDTSKPFASAPYSMPMSFLRQFGAADRSVPAFPMDTAVVYDFFGSKEEMEEAVGTLGSSGIPFADYKSGSHEVTAGDTLVASSRGTVTINGSPVNTEYTPQKISADYEYEKKQQQSLAGAFSVQNRIFIIIIVVSLVVFGGLIVVGYRLYRKKYLK
ncbi:hypothetical protein ACFC0X_11895 [Paenibacillus chitinolyticus]|uniref:hypothetical protein n=1 Tax=Paenibacillus chitinolyticus TaxID=79263 RepID=UPI0035D8196B